MPGRPVKLDDSAVVVNGAAARRAGPQGPVTRTERVPRSGPAAGRPLAAGVNAAAERVGEGTWAGRASRLAGRALRLDSRLRGNDGAGERAGEETWVGRASRPAGCGSHAQEGGQDARPTRFRLVGLRAPTPTPPPRQERPRANTLLAGPWHTATVDAAPADRSPRAALPGGPALRGLAPLPHRPARSGRSGRVVPRARRALAGG